MVRLINPLRDKCEDKEIEWSLEWSEIKNSLKQIGMGFPKETQWKNQFLISTHKLFLKYNLQDNHWERHSLMVHSYDQEFQKIK